MISICIPAYKRTEYLRRLLDSIAIQTFRDFEVVVTDDSPDGAVEALCAQYRERFPIAYSRNATTLGTPANWNRAIHLATGPWIKLMHDDDWFAGEDSLAVFADAAAKAGPDDLIFSAYEEIGLEADGKRSFCLRPSRLRGLRKNPGGLFAENRIGPPSVTLVRKRDDLRYDERLKWLVDIDFYIRALRIGRFIYIDRSLIRIGVSSQQVTSAVFRKREIEIPESFLLLEKMGTASLRSLVVYDAWWRLIRNLGITRKSELAEAGYTGPVPGAILSMIGWQQSLPKGLLKAGPVSKTIMFLHYLLHRNQIYT